MNIKSGYQVLVCGLVLIGTSCVRPHAPIITVEADELDKLIRLSQSDERSQWWPTVEHLGKIADMDDAIRDKIWVRAKVNTLGMKFAEVPPGTFVMGPDTHRICDIQKAHPIEITQGYFMAVTEVTNTQFQQLSPKFEADSRYSPDPDSPAVNVSWEDADRFCKLLSQKEGVLYRLPTEAEWEYACRAGTKTLFCFGEDPTKLAQYGWYDYARCGKASRVAMLKPNDWGIYDMHGNAVEWVFDWYSKTYYSECAVKGIVQDPKGPEQGRTLPYLTPTHVLRGGGWPARNPLACSSTARCPLPRFDRAPFSNDEAGFKQVVGFRVVRELGVMCPDIPSCDLQQSEKKR